MDYYAVLGVTSKASAAEIKEAYRMLAKKYHPDLKGNDSYYTNRFIQVKEAYDVLKDEGKRRAYDAVRNVSSHTVSGASQSTYRQSQGVVPVVYSFSCEQSYFFTGDVVSFNWSCGYVDTIQILPFGYVNALSGRASYRINNYKKRYLPIELIAVNSKTGMKVSQRLILENGLFRELSASEQKASEGVYATVEEFWMKSLVNPIGRMSRRVYAVRTLYLIAIWFVCYLLQGKGVSESVFSLVTILGSFVFLTQTARRFQDLGWSSLFGFLMLIPYVNVITYLLLVFVKGSVGANRFGRPVR